MTTDQGPIEPAPEPLDRQAETLTRRERVGATRDVLLFIFGAAGFAHEVLQRHDSERPFILLLCGVMMGLGKTLEVLGSLFGGGRRE